VAIAYSIAIFRIEMGFFSSSKYHDSETHLMGRLCLKVMTHLYIHKDQNIANIKKGFGSEAQTKTSCGLLTTFFMGINPS